MANKNLLKKIAPVILSATVAMTGMPSAAFAAEFSDEEVLLDGSAEDEEADVEIADTEADVAEDEADTDITIADADENADDAETAEEELFDAEDVFGTEGETEAFAEDGNAVESGFVYGTANIPYADFFYGGDKTMCCETGQQESCKEGRSLAADCRKCSKTIQANADPEGS